MKKNNKILYISIAILILAAGILFGTYAYYQTTISGTISGNVAKWSFKANNQTSTFNLDLGSLYPGAEGTYTLELSAEDSELDVYYELIFHNPSDIPSVFLFNTNSSYDTTIIKNVFYGNGTPNDIIANSWYWITTERYVPGLDTHVGTYGIIPAGEKISIPIFAWWPYQTQVDDSSLADGSLVSFNVTIKGQQYTGYSGSIPMNILGLNTEVITYQTTNNNMIIPIEACDYTYDEYNYKEEYCGENYYYQFEPINTSKGVILHQSN
ncbi:MAG: hypothetical protein IJB71_00710 [Bacilli bacterium]|nr:hypothetical protein [Bacilli bacterium]